MVLYQNQLDENSLLLLHHFHQDLTDGLQFKS